MLHGFTAAAKKARLAPSTASNRSRDERTHREKVLYGHGVYLTDQPPESIVVCFPFQAGISRGHCRFQALAQEHHSGLVEHRRQRGRQKTARRTGRPESLIKPLTPPPTNSFNNLDLELDLDSVAGLEEGGTD